MASCQSWFVLLLYGVLLVPTHPVPFEIPFLHYRPLQFSRPVFRIALFSDLHYGENAWELWGPAQDRQSTCVMADILDVEKPDFVIFLGDVVTANNLASPNATIYWDQALSATLERNIPWASVFGNHDDMAFEWPKGWFGTAGIPGIRQDVCEIHQYFCGTTRYRLMQNEVNHSSSMSLKGPKTLWPSLSNYVIEIASYEQSNRTAVILYFLDSGGGTYPEVISAAQVLWFEAVSQELNPDQRIPELAFWHIPSLAYREVAPMPGSVIHHPCVGSINLESVEHLMAESGIMDLLSERRSMKALFVGHNHGLDWCCPYKRMHLCFARHTGYGGYGSWTRGARILDIVEDPFELSSYIKLEDGTVTAWLKLVQSR